DAGGGEPLLARHDVSYARPVRRRAHRAGGDSTWILADAVTFHGGRVAGGGLAPLPATYLETSDARARLTAARVIRSSEVSKRTLLHTWSRGGDLYLAAHLVRDPDAPLSSYFPISFESSPDPVEDDYLDLRDIRDTDLSGCDLVVLSSCASGEAYSVGTRSAPSMGDAFLDAGASAVIDTRWRVRDESAARIAPRLAAAWRRGSAPWRAERRALMFGPSGLRHPFEWAAWSATRAQAVPVWGPQAATTARTAPSELDRPAPPAASLARAASPRAAG